MREEIDRESTVSPLRSCVGRMAIATYRSSRGTIYTYMKQSTALNFSIFGHGWRAVMEYDDFKIFEPTITLRFIM